MRILTLCYGIVMVLTLTACQENIDVFVPFDSSLISLENGDINRLFYDLEPQVSTSEWNAGEDQFWVSPQGVKFYIPAGAFVTSEGQEVPEGTIQLNLVEMLSAGQMIIHDKPNVASGNVLEAAGNFYLEANLDGAPLQLAENGWIQVQLPGVSVEAGLSANMELFWGNNQNPDFFNWEPFDNPELEVQTIEYYDSSALEDYQAYQFYTDRVGWIGCSAPRQENQPLTTLCVDLPDGFTPANTAVYFVYQGFKGVVKLFDDETQDTNTFCKDKLPSLHDGIVITLTESGDGSYYFSNSLVHLDDSQISFTIQPQKTEIETIRTFLNEL